MYLPEDPSYINPQSTMYAEPQTPADAYVAPQDPRMHIHAPIPISAYSTLLPTIDAQSPTPIPPPQAQVQAQVPPQPELACHSLSESGHPVAYVLVAPDEDVKPYNPVDYYAHVPQMMFQTPCELLTELNTRDRAPAAAPMAGNGNVNAQQPPHAAYGVISAPCESLTAPSSPSTPASACEPESEARAPRKLRVLANGKPENQRKAHFRFVAENIGFQPTDP